LPPGAIDLGGTIRAVDVELTLARAAAVLGEVGITRVGNVTGLDQVGVPTWIAVRPLARSLTVAQGKGVTHALARASAIMESIERHHAEHFVARGHRASLNAAARDPSYAPPLLLPVHPEAKLNEGSQAEWIEGKDLRSGAIGWVPRDCVDLDSVPPNGEPRLFVSSSNGLASGNTFEEAALHGLCELIERDQGSLWLARQHFDLDPPQTRVCIDDLSDDLLRALIDRCRVAGVEIAVWSVALDIDVPCFRCTAFDSSGRTLHAHRASGSGCHPYRRIALSRAITEALQSRLTCIAGGREDLTWQHYRHRIRVDTAEGERWARGLRAEPARLRLEQVREAPPSLDIARLLAWTIERLPNDNFLRAIAVDLTQQHIGFSVVHVTVAGLEGALGRRGYTPGPRMQQLLSPYLQRRPGTPS
jgi:ribosomal protein S12 methylthiotransferase accessory factor